MRAVAGDFACLHVRHNIYGTRNRDTPHPTLPLWITSMTSPLSRRKFLGSAAVGSAVIAGAPMAFTASRTTDEIITGEGEYRFRVRHDWSKLPDKYNWQTTHNVAVDKSDNLYVIHEGRREQKGHPSIFVFDANQNFVRAFGSQFQGGGHGIEVREEGGEEFLYVAAY